MFGQITERQDTQLTKKAALRKQETKHLIRTRRCWMKWRKPHRRFQNSKNYHWFSCNLQYVHFCVIKLQISKLIVDVFHLFYQSQLASTPALQKIKCFWEHKFTSQKFLQNRVILRQFSQNFYKCTNKDVNGHKVSKQGEVLTSLKPIQTFRAAHPFLHVYKQFCKIDDTIMMNLLKIIIFNSVL